MNIYDAVVKDFPFAAYSFTAQASSYVNMMGVTSALAHIVTSTEASSTSTLADTSMVTGPSKSMIIGGEASAKIPFPSRFSKENDALPFALEAWVGFETAGSVQILSHKSKTDGLYFDGDYISMGVDLDGGGSTLARWAVPDKTKTYFVAGVYSNKKVSLYIDGEIVAEESLPVDARIATATNTSLYATGATGRVLKFEAPALYTKDLQAAEIKAHYEAGRDISPAEDNVARYGGTLYKLSDEERSILTVKDVNWKFDGLPSRVAIQDALYPSYDAVPVSYAGTYTIPIQVADISTPVAVQGVKVEWNGDGNFTVDISLNNGGTWTALTNGVIATTTVGMAGTVVPLIRISFPAGRAPGLDVVRTMRITAYSSLTLTSLQGKERTMTVSSGVPTSTTWSEPVEDDDASGTFLNGASQHITLNESVETDITNIAALEMWIKWDDSGTSQYIVDSRSVTPSNASYIWLNGTRQLAFSGFTAVYVNGVARSSATFVPVVDRLYHIVAVYPTSHNAKVRFGTATTAKVGYKMIATYPTALTAAQALALFRSYYGPPVLAAEDTNAIVVSETAPSAKVYVNDWSIQGAG